MPTMGPEMNLNKDGTISARTERAAGVRAADLKEKLETALIYLMKMEKCCQGGLMKMGI